MIIGPSAQVDRSRYEKGEGELDVFYGLPRDVKFCVRCNMSNQQPMSSNEYSHGKQSTKTTMSFDEEGVCHACRFNDMKRDGEIDWDEFWAVVKGGGPGRRQRIKTRVDAHEKGQWVREAATAYAHKRASRQEAA